MTHPDPALNYPAQPAAETPAAQPEGVLSESSEAVRALQQSVVGEVGRHVQLSFRNVASHSGFSFKLRTLVLLFTGERKSDTLLDAAQLVGDLNKCRGVVGERLEADDSADYQAGSDSQKAA